MEKGYTIKIQNFEGPFDLLLFFIERDEIDIHDIPIAKITNDFLEYIRKLELLNIDVASEFILLAATLMRIKARYLIPRRQLDDEGNEIDPREELVQKLLEYKKYKSVLEEIKVLEENRSQRQERGNISSELKQLANKALVDIELESLNLFKLLKTFEDVMDNKERRNIRSTHTIMTTPYTVTNQQTFILSELKGRTKLKFDELFGKMENRLHALVTFLGLLELLNSQKVKITQGEGVNNFWLAIKNA